MITWIALILLIIGALNWGSIGLFNYDFVGGLLGRKRYSIARMIYSIVGLAGLYTILQLILHR